MSALVSRMPDKQQAPPKSTFQAASVDSALLMLLLTAKAAAFLSLLASLLQPAQQPPFCVPIMHGRGSSPCRGGCDA